MTSVNELVKAVYDGYPPHVRRRLLEIRDVILSTAALIPEVGTIEETLKWGEPAYLTSQSKSGSTIRIGWKAKTSDQYAMYFNCQTSLVDTFRTIYPELKYEGNRAILFGVEEDVPREVVAQCAEMALMYHRRK